MKIRMGKAVGAVLLLTALLCCGCRNNQLQVYETMQEAAAKGDLADVKRHIKRGADVNAKATGNETPLHWAVRDGHKAVAELLIAKGADVNAKTENGETPLSLALQPPPVDPLDNFMKGKGYAVQGEAALKDRTGMVELLKKNGARQ